MSADFQTTAEKKFAAVERWMAPLFAKLPHLPSSVCETLANVAPWLALIFGILGLFAIVSGGVLSSLLSLSFLMGGAVQLALFVSLLAGFIASVLDILAYKPLSNRKKRGWNFLFYGTVLTTLASLVEIALSFGAATNLIGSLIGFWLLFEIRDLYRP